MTKPNLLINLPPGFFATPASRAILDRAAALAGATRMTSHNTPDEIRADLAWADLLLYWSWPVLDDALLDQAKKLRWVGQLDCAKPGAETCLRRQLPVSITRWCWSPAVAEMALTLTLTLLRRVGDYHHAMRSGNESWVKSFPSDIDVRERELTGRRVGIIGFGRIGRRFRELLTPFRCQAMVHDPFLPAGVAADADATQVDLPTLLSTCDVVVVCAANNSGSMKLIGAPEIALLRRDAVFINVARSALVDYRALAERLAKGDMQAALDVFDQEPLPADEPLRRLPNCHLTPHRAGGVMASVERGLSWLVDDCERHLQGQPLQHALTAAMVPGLDG
jgi:phosphoglycerate dehydrogenase-like enzyme